MPNDAENLELPAALRECLRGYAVLLTVARWLLARLEEQAPMPSASLALHRGKFDRVEAQVRQLNGMLDAFGKAPPNSVH